MLPTYVFAWNPRLWGWPELPDDMARLRRRGHVDLEWACGRTRAIEPGSRAFFVRLGVPPKGIIGAGHTLTAPETRIHWRPEKAACGTQTNYLMLRLEFLVDLPLITFEELGKPPYSRFRWAVRQSGMRLPSTIADALEPWWEERVTAWTATARPTPRSPLARKPPPRGAWAGPRPSPEPRASSEPRTSPEPRASREPRAQSRRKRR